MVTPRVDTAPYGEGTRTPLDDRSLTKVCGTRAAVMEGKAPLPHHRFCHIPTPPTNQEPEQ